MKNTPFEQLWTKEFLSKIKREFQKSGCNFLCNACPEFEQLWKARNEEVSHRPFLYREEIKKRADIFHPDRLGLESVLFDSDGGNAGYRQIRLDFLDHEINHFH